MTLTPDQLTEIEQRANAATADCNLTRYDHGGGRMWADENELIADFYNEPDREFHYHAQGDVEALCAALREAWKEIERLKGL